MNRISLIQENKLLINQQQQLLINLAMKQAFHVLQLPLLELAEWLKTEIEANPVLEIGLPDESLKTSLDEPAKEQNILRNKSQEQIEKRRKEHRENLLIAPISLYEHLTRQVALTIEDPKNIHLAKLIIGHLNDKGFLETSLNEIAPCVPIEIKQKVLSEIQSFDPPGIGARNLQECLLLQLKLKKKETGLGYQIISEHFDALIQNRMPSISQKLNVKMKDLVETIEREIAPLDLNPGYRYLYQPTAAIIPDIHLLCVEEKWQIEINTSFLPRVQIAPIYIEALQERSLENQETLYLRRQLANGKWLKRIIQRRNDTLYRIAELTLKKQLHFFNGEKASLKPMTVKEVSGELGLHESTITRAVANKYIACPQGLFPLKSFFNQAVKTQNGEKISKHTLRKILLCTIERENKLQPMSDEEITNHLHKLGIACARRTIAKYRNALKIAPAIKRKKWC
jgi:RNA polymerase sigma-54 factor